MCGNLAAPIAHATVVHLQGAQTSAVGTKPCSCQARAAEGDTGRARRVAQPHLPVEFGKSDEHPLDSRFTPASVPGLVFHHVNQEPAEIWNLPHAYSDKAKDDQQIGPAAPVADLKIPG